MVPNVWAKTTGRYLSFLGAFFENGFSLKASIHMTEKFPRLGVGVLEVEFELADHYGKIRSTGESLMRMMDLSVGV